MKMYDQIHIPWQNGSNLIRNNNNKNFNLIRNTTKEIPTAKVLSMYVDSLIGFCEIFAQEQSYDTVRLSWLPLSLRDKRIPNLI